MTKILIVNVPNPLNRGGMAIVKGAIDCIIKNIPDAEITMQSTHFKTDNIFYDKLHNTNIVEHIWYKDHNSNFFTILDSSLNGLITLYTFILPNLLKKIGIKANNPYQKYDVIIDLNSDSLNDHYGIALPIFSLFSTFIATLSDKPVAICGASIGMFKRRTIRTIAKYVLNRVDLITVRERITLEYLTTIGINGPKIYLTADHAFLLEPASNERLDEILKKEGILHNTPLIGIAPSKIICRYGFPEYDTYTDKYLKYVELMSYIVDYTIEKYNVTVVLISHVTTPTEADYVVSKDIYLNSKHKDKIKLMGDSYLAEEYKSVIGLCNIFIGCRMHPTIASTSMCIPTVVLSYGHKFHGIIGEMMGQKDTIVDVTNMRYDDIKSKTISAIDYAYLNRYSIGKILQEKSILIKEQTLLNGKYIKELLETC